MLSSPSPLRSTITVLGINQLFQIKGARDINCAINPKITLALLKSPICKSTFLLIIDKVFEFDRYQSSKMTYRMHLSTNDQQSKSSQNSCSIDERESCYTLFTNKSTYNLAYRNGSIRKPTCCLAFSCSI